MLAERVKEWYAEYERKGLQDGMRKGLEQGRSDEARRILLGLLTHRFGAVSPAIQAQLDEAEVATLEAWTLRVLDARCPEDVFDD